MSLIENYRKLLDRNNKVLSISHKDMDGAVSTIVVQNVFKNVSFKYLKYGDVDKYLHSINYDDYDLVLLTDISPEEEESLGLSEKIFLLDHHGTAEKFHNPNKNRIVIPGNSAATLAKRFFENFFKIDLSYLNRLCELTDDYDMFVLKYPESWALNELYFYYYEESFRNRFKNGNMKFSEDELNYVKTRKKLFNDIYNNLNVYESDRIKMCSFVENRFVNDICHKLMHEEGYDVTICINSKSKTCSVRTKRDDVNLGSILKELLGGGGHMKAGAFRHDPNEEISIKIDALENYLYKNNKEIRK